MDSEVGRFVSRDPWAGWARRPHTLQRYVYAASSPVWRLDPSGRADFISGATAVALKGIGVNAEFGARVSGKDFCHQEWWDYFHREGGIPGDAVLIDGQLLEEFRAHPTVASAVAGIRAQVHQQMVDAASEVFQHYGTGQVTQVVQVKARGGYSTALPHEVVTSYLGRSGSCIVPLGNGSIFGTGSCTLNVNASLGVAAYSGTLHFKVRDAFTDPYDAFDWFDGDWNPGGTAYRIFADWDEAIAGAFESGWT